MGASRLSFQSQSNDGPKIVSLSQAAAMDKGPAKLSRSTNESLGDAPDIFIRPSQRLQRRRLFDAGEVVMVAFVCVEGPLVVLGPKNGGLGTETMIDVMIRPTDAGC